MNNFECILNVLRELTGSHTDKEMCEILEIPYGTLDTWKNRKAIPTKRLFEFADKLGVSVEELTSSGFKSVSQSGNGNIAITGDNNMVSSDTLESAKLKTKKFREFLELYKEYGNESILETFIDKLKQLEQISKG